MALRVTAPGFLRIRIGRIEPRARVGIGGELTAAEATSAADWDPNMP